jgi:hypothetical protein
MVRLAIFIASGFFLFACNSNKDERFCDCLKVSEKLDSEAAKYTSMELDATTDEGVVTLKQLMTEKDSICQPFETLGGEELIKKREACK